MKKDKAIKLAIACIDREIQRLAVQANLYTLHGLDWSSTRGAAKRRDELQDAKATLTILIAEKFIG